MSLVRSDEPGLNGAAGDEGRHGDSTEPPGGALVGASGIHVQRLVFLPEPLGFVMRPGCQCRRYVILAGT
jgi:hypothetical protein